VALEFLIELEFRNVGFFRREVSKLENPEKNPRSKGENQPPNKLNPHMTPGPVIKPGTHWWEASALTTAPTLLPRKKI